MTIFLSFNILDMVVLFLVTNIESPDTFISSHYTLPYKHLATQSSSLKDAIIPEVSGNNSSQIVKFY